MADEILRMQPERVRSLVKEGKMGIVSQPKTEPDTAGVNPFEKARQLFGEDFLGEEAIHTMEEKCRLVGIDVKFNLYEPPAGRVGAVGVVAVSNNILEKAKAEEQQGRQRLVVIRPQSMIVNGEEKPITILNLRELFKDKNPFGQGKIFSNQSWYDNEDFAKRPLEASVGLPTKEVLPESLGKKWDEQESLLTEGEERREAVETLWDTLLYYAATGKKVLESNVDWGKSRTSVGDLVSVGHLDSNGVAVLRDWPAAAASFLGVCPSR